MYSNARPINSDLPTSRQLFRSTLIAFVVAIVLLTTVVLPAEYAIDPTGIGRALGLTEMGEIKTQLAEEAAADALVGAVAAAPPAAGNTSPAAPQSAAAAPTAATDPTWRDEMDVLLAPGEGAEIKLVMTAGQRAQFAWVAEGGVVNFDTHGDGGGQAISYEKGRSVPSAEGVLEAAFDGNHGWFWRNRGDAPVRVVIRTAGDYAQMKRVI